MNAEDIAHLRKILTIHMNTALEGAQQFDEEGKIALAAKYGGRAGGLQLAIDLLEMVAFSRSSSSFSARSLYASSGSSQHSVFGLGSSGSNPSMYSLTSAS